LYFSRDHAPHRTPRRRSPGLRGARNEQRTDERERDGGEETSAGIEAGDGRLRSAALEQHAQHDGDHTHEENVKQYDNVNLVDQRHPLLIAEDGVV
jgi:hypothetical protein